ncbi:MAG: hypothetical protein N2442_04970 [Spirochaetes bacterium]|nr:hypothetical protein [Spirochaetota bacterium]
MKKLRNWLKYGAITLVPILFFLNTWQSFRFATLRKEIRKIEMDQVGLIEENKRRIIAISILNFPARIRALAENTLGLKRPSVDTYIEIRPSLGGKNTDG